MANNYSQTTIAPYIPTELITERLEELCGALGVNYEGRTETYFYAEDGIGYGELEDGTEVGEDDLVAEFQTIIKNSLGKLPWVSFETAYTCDKMRSGEFGGSAMLITADDVEYVGTNSWLSDKINKIEEEN